MPNNRVLRIGNASGYWGDDPTALARQLEKGHLDYITMDFLAEVTMSILKKQQAKDPNRGYAYDLIPMLETALPLLVKNKTRLITNAGGINPQACAKAIKQIADRHNLTVKIAVVYGDDILHDIDALLKQGANFDNMDTHQPFSLVKDRIEAANVYFGAAPVVYALKKWQPDIIITGRVTDTGITLAPMIYEFGWSLTDWDKLASGIVAGHLMECGCQVSGGNFTDWQLVPSFENMGYPLAEVSFDGSFTITKHPDTGGMISVDTVREQLFYEMGNPKAYITPDVVADFSTIQLSDNGKDRVRVSGVKGYEPTESYKISMAFADGFKTNGAIVISGPFARKKAEKFADIFWAKWKGHLTEKHTEYFGWNALHGSLGHAEDGNEILLRLGARSDNPNTLQEFAKLIPSLILSGPCGVTALGGVAKPQNIISYWPALIDKKLVLPKIALFDEKSKDEEIIRDFVTGKFVAPKGQIECADLATEPLSIVVDREKNAPHTLSQICIARSGDKGDMANIGLCARSPLAYEFIKSYVTAQKVKNWFQEVCMGVVTRYALDSLMGLNFLLEQSLGGGGSCTLRIDAQGKTFSQALLRQRLCIPEEVLLDIKNYTKNHYY